MIGRTLGHYRVVEKIGAGGMGEVYRARDERLERDVAVKVLPAGTLADEAARKRFRKEALALSKLNHPNIATIFDFDTQQGVDYLVMEHISGETLADKLKAGPLPESQVLRVGAQVAEGLEAGHREGIVHRDIKPGNLRLTPDGRVKILDFGLAKAMRPASEVTAATTTESLTQTQAIVGTLPYMAPEQLRGEPIDARSDIYAAGAVLYEMATGQRPFPQTQAAELTGAILHQAPRPPRELHRRCSPGFERIILKALAKDPELRYQSARELRVDLHWLLAAGPVPAPERRRAWVERFPAVGVKAAIGGAVLLLVLLTLFGAQVPARLRQLLRGGAGGSINSLAVLPLENLSRDPEQDYFADGMTEALLTELSKISALRVISRTSVMQFKGTKKTVPEIARELNVDAVIEGSVQREGDQVRITVQLIHGPTDRHVWADSYQRELRGILALQSEVAQAIAQEINIKVSADEAARLVHTRPVDPEAHEAYLKGRYYWNKSTEEGLKKAIGYFNQAIEEDPSYAPAYAGLAESYALFGDFEILPPKEAYPRAQAAATKALELDDALAEAHTALGLVRLEYDRDWAAAEREFQRAIELNPSYPTAHQFYSWYLGAVLRPEECIAEARRALELDPLSVFRNADLGITLYLVGQYDRAIEQSQKALELDPNLDYAHWTLGLAYVQKAMYEEGIAHLEKAVTFSGSSPRYVASLGYAYAVAGRRHEARKILDKLNELSKHRYVSPYFIAAVYTGLGDKENALEWLEKAYQDHSGWLAYIKMQPEFAPLRSDPRFQDLLRRMNFPE